MMMGKKTDKNIPVRETVGGIILNHNNDICLVENKFRGFPKGHQEKGESKLDTAYREIEEETSLIPDKLTLVKELGTYRRTSFLQKEIKNITLYLFTVLEDFNEIPLFKIKDRKIVGIQGVSIQEIYTILHYPEDKHFLHQHQTEILNRSKDPEFLKRISKKSLPTP